MSLPVGRLAVLTEDEVDRVNRMYPGVGLRVTAWMVHNPNGAIPQPIGRLRHDASYAEIVNVHHLAEDWTSTPEISKRVKRLVPPDKHARLNDKVRTSMERDDRFESRMRGRVREWRIQRTDRSIP